MTWPSSDVYNGNLVNSNSSPAAARGDLLDLMNKFNQLRNHLPTFMQGFVSQPDSASARVVLSIGRDAFRVADPVALTGVGVFLNYAKVSGQGFNNTTGEYTVPTTGKYLINIVPYWAAGSAVQTVVFGVHVNGAEPVGGVMRCSVSCLTTTAAGVPLQGSRVAILDLVAGDKVRCGVLYNSVASTIPFNMEEFSMGRVS